MKKKTKKRRTKLRPEFEKFFKEIHEEIKLQKKMTLKWIKRLFWPSMNELDTMEKEVIMNLYTGDLTKKEFAERYRIHPREIGFIKQEIKDKIVDFMLKQTPVDTLLYEIFRGMSIMGADPKTKWRGVQ